jgi:hypothetical protein
MWTLQGMERSSIFHTKPTPLIRPMPLRKKPLNLRTRHYVVLPPKADISEHEHHFCFVPKPEVSGLTQSPRRHERAMSDKFGYGSLAGY